MLPLLSISNYFVLGNFILHGLISHVQSTRKKLSTPVELNFAYPYDHTNLNINHVMYIDPLKG